jgi:hypothetical protein
MYIEKTDFHSIFQAVHHTVVKHKNSDRNLNVSSHPKFEIPVFPKFGYLKMNPIPCQFIQNYNHNWGISDGRHREYSRE